jgi:glycosyltransferase involved in cell wall biosynthesis
MRKLRILTWHVHGSYLYYLSQIPHEIIVPYKDGRPDRFIGLTRSYPWPSNLIEVPAEQVKNESIDCIIYQTPLNYREDQYEILNERQLKLPRLYLEHDPPQGHPTDTRHFVDDPSVVIVHVTDFNALMWDNGVNRVAVIDHGIKSPGEVRYSGELERGLVIINNIQSRGRRLGYDLFKAASTEVPLDLVGMGWKEAGGIGEISHSELFHFAARYRFFYNPIRYTSLGLGILEAMSAGLPVIGLATTELVSVIRNGENGFTSLRPAELIAHMKRLLADAEEARRLSDGAVATIRSRFSIERFVDDWNRLLQEVTAV